MPQKRLNRIIEQTQDRLRVLKELGISELPKESVDPVFRKKHRALEELRKEIGDCGKCELGKTRTCVVFGEGDPNSAVMFIGEAPGEDEDKSGRPFVGAAGRILTDIIERGMKLARKSVFIGNVIKCRPPQNRDPLPEEVKECRTFLERQVRIIRPKVIVALGKHAAHLLLESNEPISLLRGKWGDYLGIPVMPTYHPAYLLYNNSGKREVWNDIKQVIQFLEKEKAS